MNYADRLSKVAVLGAAGKMGSGITLLTLLEMTDLSLKQENKDKEFLLYAIDVSEHALKGLILYLRDQVKKAAEKKMNFLRQVYADNQNLIENSEMIQQYVDDAMLILRPVTTIQSAYNVHIVFEAVSEKPDLKVKLFSEINQHNPNKPWFFTNTSSIPITYLDEQAKLEGRIIGVHFYNPPAVQKLVEVIRSKHTSDEIAQFVSAFIKAIRKVEVPSNDVAGFIGNGHFMRDALHALQQVEQLQKQMPFVDAIYVMNKVSQDFLIRPMGIFQLIDYVGIDVCQYIMKVMNDGITGETIHSPILDRYLEMGIRGGQNYDGSQKDGFLKYEKGKIAGIFDPDRKDYIPIEQVQSRCEALLGPLPSSHKPWREVIGLTKREEFLQQYFKELHQMNTMGADLARAYLKRSKEIGQLLVSSGVAFSEQDVNTVLLTGFYHAYGPINNYVK